MSSGSSFGKKTVDVADRRYLVQILKFENGYFVSITEGSAKIGSMVASIAVGPTPATITIIPSKSESFFIKLISERIAKTIKGISVVSVFTQSEISIEEAKVLMNEIMEMAKIS